MQDIGFRHRGVMLDLARLTERHEYYAGLLPQLADWGFNLLHLHITDDQGCALRFPSRPELATPHAYSPGEMRAFVAEAARLGIEVVPEIEAFGHTGFITRIHPHLAENAEERTGFTGMCPFEPEAQAILRDIVRDTVEIFRPRLIHAGLDEVSFGTHPLSKKLLRAKPANALFAEHVEWVHELIAGLGGRMAMWGDHCLKDREGVIAARTPRDTVIFDWHYDWNYCPDSLDFFIERGFEVYGAPSIQRYRNRVLSNWESFSNVRRFSAYALDRRRRKRGSGFVSGMVATVWCPYRYVPGTIEYPLALCGRLFSSSEPEPLDFAEQFAGEFWGLKGADAAAAGAAVEALYDAAPTIEEYHRIVFGANLWNQSDAYSRADRHICEQRLKAAADAGRTLRTAVKSAGRNADRLRDLAAAAKFLEAIYRFGAAGRKKDPGWPALRAAMQSAWKRSRYADGPDYAGRPARPPDRSDADRILRHVNRLAR